jgi:hypothetical protein
MSDDAHWTVYNKRSFNMKSISSYCFTLSTIFLASCGFDSGKGLGLAVGSNQEPTADVQAASIEQGSLSFDLSGVQIESESGDSGLSLTDLAVPAQTPPPGFTFVFTLSGTNGDANWARTIEFPFEQKNILIDKIPVGKVAVDLKLVNQEKKPTKGASGEATIAKDRKSALTLILAKLTPEADNGELVVTVADEEWIGLCYRKAPPLCALPPDGGQKLIGQTCSVTIQGKVYEHTVTPCGPQVQFTNWLCTQGVKLKFDEKDKITCKDAIRSAL